MTPKRLLLLAVSAAVAVGIAVGAGATWMAFDHNPQGEFFDTQTGAIHPSTTAPLFLSGLLLGAVATLLIEVAAYVVIASITAIQSKPSK
jgi:uncharacterized protein (DUF2062 family)